MKRKILLIFLFLASLFIPHESRAAASAPMQVSVQVKAHMEARIERLAPEVIVTAADIANGYVEIGAAIRLEIRTNTGYICDFPPLPVPFEGIIVTGMGPTGMGPSGMGNEFYIDKNGGFITREPEEGIEARTYLLGLKFVLAENAVPGTYPLTDLLHVSPSVP